MGYTDRTLTCRDCGSEFLFSSGEQEFFDAKGLIHEPGRCARCRTAYKQARGIVDEQRAERDYFVTTCAECGQEAKVPFVPRNDRPVYCSPCFDQIRHASAAQAL